MIKKIIISIILISILLAGCTPIPDSPDPPIPVTNIRIKPDRADVELGGSIELACYDQLDRAVVAIWGKCCNGGELSTEVGKTCIYTAPGNKTGVMIIYADYEGLRAITNIRGIK